MSTPARTQPAERDEVRNGPVRENLCRTAPFQLLRADDGSQNDGLTIEGYGAVFNSVTNIDSWEGSFEEEILPGAFRKSLRERVPRMQFDHGHHPLLGSLPIGRWTKAEEDARGLSVTGRLTDNWLTQPFRDAIAAGAVEGMSFRFAVVRDQWFDRDGKKLKDDELGELLWRGAGERGPLRRKLQEVKVSEVGPVTWPAYEDTEVGVRSVDGRKTVVIDLGRLMSGHVGEQARLAKLVAVADRATGDSPPAPKSDTETPDVESGSEPRPTEASADEHPPTREGEPRVTDTSAGEHSSNASTPANPVERAADIKARFRRVTDRVLALPPLPHMKESAR